MKNNNLPLKERYNNFIQKHPKFWFTFIYGILMFVLSITMFIAALNPPDNNTANADYQSPSECPNLEYYNYYYQENDITPELVSDILQDLPAGNFRIVEAPTIFFIQELADNDSTYRSYYAFRYIVCCHRYFNGIDLYSYYFSNSNDDPIINGDPSDAFIIATNKFAPSHYKFSHAENVIINIGNFSTISYFPTLFEHYRYFKLSDLCNFGASPDDLKAEYDKGFNAGYDKGKLDGSSVDLNPISLFLQPIQTFLDVELFGTFSIGAVLSTALFVYVALLFIKMFAGG